jgi:hypothetical protein
MRPSKLLIHRNIQTSQRFQGRHALLGHQYLAPLKHQKPVGNFPISVIRGKKFFSTPAFPTTWKIVFTVSCNRVFPWLGSLV